jgi:hypothetical protein
VTMAKVELGQGSCWQHPFASKDQVWPSAFLCSVAWLEVTLPCILPSECCSAGHWQRAATGCSSYNTRDCSKHGTKTAFQHVSTPTSYPCTADCLQSVWQPHKRLPVHARRFGGNPVCSAGGRAVLRVIDNERIQVWTRHTVQDCHIEWHVQTDCLNSACSRMLLANQLSPLLRSPCTGEVCRGGQPLAAAPA